MTTTLVLIVVAVAVITAIAFFTLRTRDPVAVAASDENADPAFSASGEAMIVGDVMPLDSNEPTFPPGTTQLPPNEVTFAKTAVSAQREVVEDRAAQRAYIRWPKRFEPPDAPFDDATRLSLLRDLGIVRAPWGVPLLTQAYEEEPAAEHRRAALRALAAYRHPDTQPTFESVLHDDQDEESRTIAAAALSALQIRAALPS